MTLFVGENKLELNQATMIKIVQYYVDNKIIKSGEVGPTVTGVKAAPNKVNTIFEVTFNDTDKKNGGV